MAESENLQKLKDILAKMADLIREAEGHSDPILVADMRQKIAEMDIAKFNIDGNRVLRGCTLVNGATDPSVPDDTLDYYRKLLTNFANKIRPNSWTKLTIDQIEQKEDEVCGAHKTEQNKYEIRIPNGVTAIGNNALYNTYYAALIDIPASVTSIGNTAFKSCSSLQSIVIPNSVTTIGDYTFDSCYALQSAVIPDSVTSIGRGAFNYCHKLQSIVIPNSVTTLGNSIFSNCPALESVVLPADLTSISSGLFFECNSLKDVNIPDSVVSIESSAFNQCGSLRSITIPSSVTSISDSAFYNVGLVEIVNKSSLDIQPGSYGAEHIRQVIRDESESKISINEQGFSFYDDGSEKLLLNYRGDETTVVIPSDMTSIEHYCFFNNPMQEVVIPNTVSSIGNYAFQRCTNLASVIIPESVSSFGECIFNACDNLTTAEIRCGLSTLPRYTFGNCYNLSSVSLPDSITLIDYNAFSNCSSLQSINLPAHLKAIGYQAFAGCGSLTQVELPNEVEEIGQEAFSSCRSLANISLSENLKKIIYHAFNNTPALNYTTIDGCKFLGNANNAIMALIDAKDCTVESYEIPAECSVIAMGAFENSGVKHIAWQDKNLRSTTVGAFYNGKSIESVTIPDSVVVIEDWTFESCSSLKRVGTDSDPLHLPSSLHKIGDWAFQSCDLDSVEIPSSVVYIGKYAFYTCRSLTSVVIGGNSNSGTIIKENAFQYCSALLSVTMGDGVTEIEKEAFYDCDNITEVHIPSTVQSIGREAFYFESNADIYFDGSTQDCRRFKWEKIVNTDYVQYIHCTNGDYDILNGDSSSSNDSDEYDY